MRIDRIIIIGLFISQTSCVNFYGDLNLGADFYYLTEPTFNSVVVPVNKKEPHSAQSFVIQSIETLGYDRDYILATSQRNDTIFYWIIDKSKEPVELGYDQYSNLRLSNVKQVDSTEFYEFNDNELIDLKPKLYYQKKAGWR